MLRFSRSSAGAGAVAGQRSEVQVQRFSKISAKVLQRFSRGAGAEVQVQVQGCAGEGVQGCAGAGVQGCRGAEVLRC